MSLPPLPANPKLDFLVPRVRSDPIFSVAIGQTSDPDLDPNTLLHHMDMIKSAPVSELMPSYKYIYIHRTSLPMNSQLISRIVSHSLSIDTIDIATIATHILATFTRSDSSVISLLSSHPEFQSLTSLATADLSEPIARYLAAVVSLSPLIIPALEDIGFFAGLVSFSDPHFLSQSQIHWLFIILGAALNQITEPSKFQALIEGVRIIAQESLYHVDFEAEPLPIGVFALSLYLLRSTQSFKDATASIDLILGYYKEGSGSSSFFCAKAIRRLCEVATCENDVKTAIISRKLSAWICKRLPSADEDSSVELLMADAYLVFSFHPEAVSAIICGLGSTALSKLRDGSFKVKAASAFLLSSFFPYIRAQNVREFLAESEAFHEVICVLQSISGDISSSILRSIEAAIDEAAKIGISASEILQGCDADVVREIASGGTEKSREAAESLLRKLPPL